MKGPDARDTAVERLLREAVVAPEAPGDACLDGETLAAWLDGGLSGGALAQAETHVASCARCQALVAAIVRTDLPVAPKPVEARRWLLWLVPGMAAAAAVAIWIAVPPERSPVAPSVTSPAAAERAQADRAATVVAPDPGTPAPSALAGASTPAMSKAQEAPASPAPVARSNAFETAAVPAPAPAPAPTPPPAPASALEAAPAAPAGVPPARSAAARALDAMTINAQAGPVVIVSPNPATRWRSTGDAIERSSDAGATWRRVATSPSPLLAGSSPSATTCWVVGRGGVVLVSADGETFTPMHIPEPVDLVSVNASDALTATVTTVDGRSFQTTDGGRSWTPRSLQEF